MVRLNRLVHCGLIIIFCGFTGYIVNALVPIESSWAYFNILGPIIIIFGLIFIIIGMKFMYDRNIKILIGGIISLASILLSITLPELLGWYTIESYEGHGHSIILIYGIYLTGLGVLVIKGTVPIVIGVVLLELIGGILVVLGSLGCFISNLIKSKKVGIFSGILMILGPIIFIIDLLIGLPIFNEFMELNDANSLSGTILNGTAYYLDSRIRWNIGIGFFICLIGAILALISALKIDEF